MLLYEKHGVELLLTAFCVICVFVISLLFLCAITDKKGIVQWWSAMQVYDVAARKVGKVLNFPDSVTSR